MSRTSTHLEDIMKTKLLALTLAGATAFAFTPKPALARDNTGAAIAGGVIGGLIVGSILADSHDSRVVVVNDRDRCDDGYWKIVETRVWVPGSWVIERGHHRTYRRYIEGHYECRNERVWVAYDRRDRHDREVGRYERREDRYGYRR